MKRRLFIQSGSIALATTGLAACGGGGGGDASAEAELTEAEAARKRPRAPAPEPTSPPVAAPSPAPAPVAPAPVAPAPADYPAWDINQAYAAGAIVRYIPDGQLYVAKFATHPRDEPTISTYYWAPYVAAAPSPAPAPADYPAWDINQAYAAGAIVRYTPNGQLYVAKFATHPRDEPTISTYYWASYAAAAPSPAPADGLPAKILACYFTGWDTAFPITEVPLDFNVIYLFHAVPDGVRDTNNTGNGSFKYEFLNNVTADQVQFCRNKRGQKVILTVGGANNGFNFDNRTKSQNFVNSFRKMYTDLGGVDGCDFNNFEAGIGSSPTELMWIAEQLRASYGQNFAITAPPQPNSAKDRSIMQAMSGALTYAGPQYYDWDGFNAPNYISDSIRQWVELVGDASKVVVGMGGSYSNGPSVEDCIREWDIIKKAHPTIRGMFCWSAQTNRSAGNRWGSTMKSMLA